ncbi:hypothetical protein HYQ46_002053 [Verticillium longisporum]|nr:hypothetical protein HYQ44_010373 [Verticillium longisporum]KAG7149050.1 hypothetical protein HYQ46_002053 [Verticillium longisporum]
MEQHGSSAWRNGFLGSQVPSQAGLAVVPVVDNEGRLTSDDVDVEGQRAGWRCFLELSQPVRTSTLYTPGLAVNSCRWSFGNEIGMKREPHNVRALYPDDRAMTAVAWLRGMHLNHDRGDGGQHGKATGDDAAVPLTKPRWD